MQLDSRLYREGEWKVKKHGTDGKHQIWRKLHLAVDTDTHEIIAAGLKPSGVTDAEVLPNLLKKTRSHQGDLGRLRIRYKGVP